MPETKAQQKKSDVEFFTEVKSEKVLRDALQRHGLNYQDVRFSQHNSVLLITKGGWTLPIMEGQPKTLSVHFEARKRSEFRLEIGIEPYQGHIARDHDLIEKIQPVLAEKTRLFERLRALVLNASTLPAHIRMNTKALRAPNAIDSHTILKFTGNLPDALSPAKAAGFFAEVIDALAPLIETDLAAYIRSRE